MEEVEPAAPEIATSGNGAYRFTRFGRASFELGADGDRLVLDFNFSYNPSCAYDPSWVCPLAPPANRLPVEVGAGEATR